MREKLYATVLGVLGLDPKQHLPAEGEGPLVVYPASVQGAGVAQDHNSL